MNVSFKRLKPCVWIQRNSTLFSLHNSPQEKSHIKIKKISKQKLGKQLHAGPGFFLYLCFDILCDDFQAYSKMVAAVSGAIPETAIFRQRLETMALAQKKLSLQLPTRSTLHFGQHWIACPIANQLKTNELILHLAAQESGRYLNKIEVPLEVGGINKFRVGNQ